MIYEGAINVLAPHTSVRVGYDELFPKLFPRLKGVGFATAVQDSHLCGWEIHFFIIIIFYCERNKISSVVAYLKVPHPGQGDCFFVEFQLKINMIALQHKKLSVFLQLFIDFLNKYGHTVY